MSRFHLGFVLSSEQQTQNSLFQRVAWHIYIVLRLDTACVSCKLSGIGLTLLVRVRRNHLQWTQEVGVQCTGRAGSTSAELPGAPGEVDAHCLGSLASAETLEPLGWIQGLRSCLMTLDEASTYEVIAETANMQTTWKVLPAVLY